MTKRRRFSADFKARVALEALRGDKMACPRLVVQRLS